MKIAIVTVTYNAEKEIRKTIKSVLEQDYCDIEYWIIDGQSTDNTMKIAKEEIDNNVNDKIIVKCISKKDKGIFDAMNSSMSYLSSEARYILFLNAGDFFVDTSVVSNIFTEDVRKSNYDVIYGDYYAYSKNRRKKYVSEECEKLTDKMICTHQAMFTKTTILEKRPYDIMYKMTADYDFYLDLFLSGKNFLKKDVEVVYFDIGGISQKNAKITQNEKLAIQYKYKCITQKEYNIRKRKIGLVCMKKRIVSYLPDIIRFKDYEKIKVE